MAGALEVPTAQIRAFPIPEHKQNMVAVGALGEVAGPSWPIDRTAAAAAPHPRRGAQALARRMVAQHMWTSAAEHREVVRPRKG